MTKTPSQINVEIELIENMMLEVSTETERLEKFTDRILTKLTSVITLSTIVTFLSFAFTENASAELLRHYLTWVMPFLIAGIALWILTFKVSAATKMNSLSVIASESPEVTLQYLKARLQMGQQLHSATNDIYEKTRKLFILSLSFTIAYLVAYTLSFYLFVFFTIPSLSESILISIILLLISYLFKQWYSKPRTAVNVQAEVKIPTQARDSLPTN